MTVVIVIILLLSYCTSYSTPVELNSNRDVESGFIQNTYLLPHNQIFFKQLSCMPTMGLL